MTAIAARARRASEAGTALDRALRPLKRDLTAVRQRMLAQLEDPVVRKVVYLVTAGGKRLRPALVFLAAQAGASPDRAALIDTATAVELIHTATLIHDDIIDQSPLRRAQPTFHMRWGTERAVLMGDYLYATAFTLLARAGSTEVLRVMSDVCRQLCRGELREVEARYRLDLTEAEYFDIIRDKTASLISGCCRSGALLGGCAPEAVERLTQFGINFGLAFQIIDDCLDLTGDQRQLGKSILTDLDKGCLSLPIIYLTRRLRPRERGRLFAPLRTHATDPAFLARVARAAQETGAVDQARERAGALMTEAQELVDGLALDGWQEAYQQLTAYAVLRRS